MWSTASGDYGMTSMEADRSHLAWVVRVVPDEDRVHISGPGGVVAMRWSVWCAVRDEVAAQWSSPPKSPRAAAAGD